jgi:hypothetical protein
LFNSVLGADVEEPSSVPRQGGGFKCLFVGKGKAQGGLISLDNESTAARFMKNKTDAELLGGKSTPVSGLGDQAFFLSSTPAIPDLPVQNTLAAREGNRAVLVITSLGTLEELTALMKQLLAK